MSKKTVMLLQEVLGQFICEHSTNTTHDGLSGQSMSADAEIRRGTFPVRLIVLWSNVPTTSPRPSAEETRTRTRMEDRTVPLALPSDSGLAILTRRSLYPSKYGLHPGNVRRATWVAVSTYGTGETT